MPPPLPRRARPPRGRGTPFAPGDGTLLSLSLAHSASGDLPALDNLLRRLSLERRPLPERLFLPILRCYSRLRLPSLALRLFDELLPRFRCAPSALSLNTALNALVSASLFRDALAFHAARAVSIPPTTLTLNLLLKSLCRLRLPDRALALLRDLPHLPDAFSYSTLIDALVRARRLHEAAALLDEMSVEGLPPAPPAFNALIRGFCLAGDLPRASRLVRAMLLKGCRPTAVTYNTLIHGLCRKPDLEAAIALLSRMVRDGCEPTEVTYGTVIAGLAAAGRVPEALRMAEMMSDRGVRLGPHAYSALITGLFATGRADDAIAKWDEMVKAIEPNAVLYTNLIDGLCRIGRVREAEERLREMTARGYAATAVTYGAMIRGYFEAGMAASALEAWREMAACGIRPDEVGYSILIRGLCAAGGVREGLMVWRHMLGRGCAPDVVAYTSMMKGLCDAGRVREAARLLAEMEARGDPEPDAMAYNVVVAGMCRAGDLSGAMAVVETMAGGCDPDLVTCDALLVAVAEGEGRGLLAGLAGRLCARGRCAGAAGVVEEMVRRGFVPDWDTWEKVAGGVCERRKVLAALRRCWRMVVSGFGNEDEEP